MGLTIFLLRNAETYFCRTGRYCSADNVPLTAKGQRMAHYFAKAYQDISWQAILCSPLNHAVATASPLCDTIGMPLQKCANLRELSFGAWEGLSPEEVSKQFHDDYIRWLADPAWNAPTQGEKGIRVARRCALVLGRLEENFQHGNVLIVSHKATLRIMLCSLLGVDVGRYRDRLAMPVTAVTRVELMEYGPFVRVFNDCAHLPPHLRRRTDNASDD